ncbi:MAG: Ger(x)C family spore germination protein [Desulfotomaculales bacterium]
MAEGLARRRLPGRLWAVLCFFLGLCLAAAGCWGYREIDETAHVVALGVDRGEHNVLTVTAQIVIPKGIAGPPGGGGGGGGEGGPNKTFFVASVDAPTVLSALELLNAFVDRRVRLDHTKVLVFSRELAKEGIRQYLDPLARYREFRRSTFMMVAEGKARDLLEKSAPILEDNPAKYYESLFLGYKYTEFIPLAQYHYFYNAQKSLAQVPVAILGGLGGSRPFPEGRTPKSKGSSLAGGVPRQGGPKMEIMGGAVFRGGRLVGEMNGDETGIANMLRGTFRRTIVSIEDPHAGGRFVVVDVRPRRRPRVEVEIAGGAPVVRAQVFLEGDLMSVQSGYPYERPQNIPVIEHLVARHFENRARGLVAKSQNEWQADIFGFGNAARRLMPTWPAWQRLNWPALYPEADVRITFDFRIRRTGLVHETARLRE